MIAPTGTLPAAARSRQGGFSLTEMLTYVAIVSMLSMTAVPVFSEIQQEYNLRGAVRRVYGEMQKARMAAVTRNARYKAQVTSDGLVYLQEYDVDTGLWESLSTTLHNDTPGIYVTGTTTVVFRPNGTVSDQVLLTVLNSAGMQKRIRIDRSGSIEVL
jgi:Tfp pilus assembly protein FimT